MNEVTTSASIAAPVKPLMTVKRAWPMTLADVSKKRRKRKKKRRKVVEATDWNKEVSPDKWVVTTPSGEKVTGKWRQTFGHQVFWKEHGGGPLFLPKEFKSKRFVDPSKEDFDWGGEAAQSLEKELQDIKKKMAKSGKKLPPGAQDAVDGMLAAIKAKDGQAFVSAQKGLKKKVG